MIGVYVFEFIWVHIGLIFMNTCHAYGQCSHVFSQVKWMDVQSCQIHGCAFSHAKWMCVRSYESDLQLHGCMFEYHT